MDLRKRLKSAILERWKLPYSPLSGLSPAVYRRFRGSGAINVIDVGAHSGDFTLAMQKVCGVRRSILVEPIQNLADALRANPALLNHTVFDCLVAESNGDIELKVYEHFPYISSALSIDMAVHDVAVIARGEPKLVRRPARTLDSLVAEAGMDAIDLVKIDVQGFEDKVINGAKATLERAQFALVEVSFRPLYIGSAVFADIYKLMIDSGFALLELEPAFRGGKGELLQADAIFSK